MAEELKLPLLALAGASELAGNNNEELTARMAMRLIDGYVLGMYVQSQTVLQLEPLTLSSVIHDAAQELLPVAKRQGYELQVDTNGRLGPIMGDRRLLQHAFVLAGNEMLQASGEEGQKPILTLASYKSRLGISAGLYCSGTYFSSGSLRRGKALAGAAQQMLPSVSSGSGAGILVADGLLKGLASSFRAGRYHGQAGLTARFVLSQQMQLV